jgi:hypothetical protein
MPDTINFPLIPGPRPRRRGLIIVVVLVLLVLFSARTFLSYWVDMLWFGSLGYAQVFWTSLRLEWGVFAVFVLATFAALYGAYLLLRHAHGDDLPATHTLVFAGQPVELPVGKVLDWIVLALAALISLGTGAAMKQQWPTFALWWHAPQSATAVDPILGQSLNFYLFTLPVWQTVAGWVLTLAVLVCVLAVLFLLVSGGGRFIGGQLNSGAILPWRGLLFSAAFLFLALAARTWLSRYEMLFEHHNIFDGVTYTDAHIKLGGALILALALILGALIAVFAAFAKPRGAWLAAAIAPVVVCFILIAVAGWYVDTFVVNPNRLNRERQYISNNIASTRAAYGLDRFVQKEFPAETTVASADPAANQPTLNNIRLWDVQALQDTLRQVQEIRTYYDFPDIDIDRYRIDGQLRETMLAVRELNVDKLPESSRNWINDKLIYTHGYGITMNPVNGFTAEGLPSLYLANMPVESRVPGLAVNRPEIYFGELTNTDVYVNTRQQEFNYPEGQNNNFTAYSGSGGIPMGGFLRRILLALDRGDLTKVPFSDDIGPQSRLLIRRNIRDRLAALAPFLTFDSDPYVVIGDDGHLRWIVDAYTSSDTYPYSTHGSLGGDEVNYVRNSVKAVIDAYDGSTTLYVFDSADPILAAWRSIFPGLFADPSTMPAGMRAHVRYPETLLSLQADVYGLYHMTDPDVFFNREDQWNVATENAGQQGAQDMKPNLVLMTLPGEQNLEFVEILPFTPRNRNNLIGWIAARSDGEHYGTAEVFDFPKTRLVDGPQQIEARIDQNAQLSGQLTLWNQQGSHVRRGSLLVIPCGKALLYAEPIYLQADRSPMPELRLVVLALQDRLAYGPDFATAASALFGSGESSVSAVSTPQQAPAPGPQPAGQPQPKMADLNGLIQQASRDFSDYQRLTSEGKLSEAGQKLDDLKRVLGQLNSMPK